MKINPASAGKLASLSALGAGALVVSMGHADATTIYGLPINGKVGFSSGFHASVSSTFNPFPSVGARFFTNASHGGLGHSHSNVNNSSWIQSVRFSGFNGLKFATNGGMLRLFAAGATLGAGPRASSGVAALRSWWTQRVQNYHYPTMSGHTTGGRSTTVTYPQFHNASPGSFANQYALFTFQTSGHTYDGWIQMSLSTIDQYGAAGGPDLTLINGAVEDVSGGIIHAGDQPTSPVPEPGTLATTGLGALILGAAGVRRWRAARQKQSA